MSVRRDEAGRILLVGDCPVEEAETLLELLLATPGVEIDLTSCTRLHTSLAQLLLAARPPLAEPCGDAFVEKWIAPLLRREPPQ